MNTGSRALTWAIIGMALATCLPCMSSVLKDFPAHFAEPWPLVGMLVGSTLAWIAVILIKEAELPITLALLVLVVLVNGLLGYFVHADPLLVPGAIVLDGFFALGMLFAAVLEGKGELFAIDNPYSGKKWKL